ncbi:hypothetical protein, partial [Streptomyces sp. NPDC054863]
RRTLTQPTGYALHPWADLKPPGTPASLTTPTTPATAPTTAPALDALTALDGRTFHHASPGSAG